MWGRLIPIFRWSLGFGLTALCAVVVIAALRNRAWSFPTTEPAWPLGDEPAPAPADQPAPARQEPVTGSCPASHPIKGNVSTHGDVTERIYHVPGSQHYARTDPEVCFATVADAEAAGFRAPRHG